MSTDFASHGIDSGVGSSGRGQRALYEASDIGACRGTGRCAKVRRAQLTHIHHLSGVIKDPRAVRDFNSIHDSAQSIPLTNLALFRFPKTYPVLACPTFRVEQANGLTKAQVAKLEHAIQQEAQKYKGQEMVFQVRGARRRSSSRNLNDVQIVTFAQEWMNENVKPPSEVSGSLAVQMNRRAAEQEKVSLRGELTWQGQREITCIRRRRSSARKRRRCYNSSAPQNSRSS